MSIRASVLIEPDKYFKPYFQRKVYVKENAFHSCPLQFMSPKHKNFGEADLPESIIIYYLLQQTREIIGVAMT